MCQIEKSIRERYAWLVTLGEHAARRTDAKKVARDSKFSEATAIQRCLR
jgi:hypothetical protein